MSFNSLDDVLQEQLEDLYSAEQQLVAALPGIAAAAHSDDLTNAIDRHLDQTRGHVLRLEQVFDTLDLRRKATTCKAMQGLIAEGDDAAKTDADPIAKDAALIAAAQRVEHYEIAGYGTARALAGELGYEDAAKLLGATLDEESAADKLLTKIATGGLFRAGLNEQAHR
jgi:ferritin-like metal-binding protein YciE